MNGVPLPCQLKGRTAHNKIVDAKTEMPSGSNMDRQATANTRTNYPVDTENSREMMRIGSTKRDIPTDSRRSNRVIKPV